MWWIIGILALLIISAACVHTYKNAEINELHRLRAAFEKKKHALEEYYKKPSMTAVSEGHTYVEQNHTEEIKGEIEGIEIILRIMQDEEDAMKLEKMKEKAKRMLSQSLEVIKKEIGS